MAQQFRGEMKIPFEIMAVVDGDTTVAVLHLEDANGDETQLTASSKRHPDDTSNPKIGVDLAVARLLRKAAKHIEKPHRRLLDHEEPVTQPRGSVNIDMTADQAEAAVRTHLTRHHCGGRLCSRRYELMESVPNAGAEGAYVGYSGGGSIGGKVSPWAALHAAFNRKFKLQ